MPTQPTPDAVSGTRSDPNDSAINIPIGSVPDAIRNAPHPDQSKAQTFLINGKEVQLTPEQQVEYIQKAAAADEKFRQAAETRKEAERAIALQEDLEAIIRDGDVDAFRRMGAAMGIPGDQVEEQVSLTFGEQDEEDQVPPPEARGREVTVGNKKVDIDSLSPEIQRLLLRAEKQRIDEIVTAALDSNEKLSYNMGQFDAKGQKAVRRLVEEKIRGRLAATNGDFGDGSHILREVLPEVEEMLEALGSPRRQTAPLGMGPSPGGGNLEVYPTKRPDHVPSNDGRWEQHILEDLAYNMAQVERSKR